jgi:GTP pyrophosphokinase
VRQALDAAGIKAEISGRSKHIYSIWNKMRNKHLRFDQLYDLRAVRIIVEDERACYTALALAHAMWTPVAEEFDAYISRPKPNGYRSLHTVVADVQGRTFEIQIRTREMHVFAEYGLAAHWRYKEAGAAGGTQQAGSGYDKKIAWMRRLLAWEKGDESAQDSASAVQPQPAAAPSGPAAAAPPRAVEHIYVMTPQARVIELPAQATPVDFAYALHTDLGHRCRGARVDGNMAPLSTQLKTGQTVEIIAAKAGGPSRDWLNPQLGYLAAKSSRAKVRAWFNAIELQARIAQGQELVAKELQRLGKTAINLEHLAQQLGFAKADDLYVSVAKDEFSLRQIDAALKTPSGPVAPAQEEPVFTPRVAKAAASGRDGVLVMGVDSLMTQLARCCRPAPPDEVAGFVTRGRGVSVHRAECAAYRALVEKHPERAIPVQWGEHPDAVYPVDFSIHARQSPNLLRDLSEVFSRLRLNVVGVNTQSRGSLAHMVFTVEARGGDQIAKALAALAELDGVTAARR